ncbi:unnamed protein product [Amoebophrya sp. A120]|nr:unnamed protein product [Amoebophrya sp. A120]|eukprot:GSA120T00005949001.1
MVQVVKTNCLQHFFHRINKDTILVSFSLSRSTEIMSGEEWQTLWTTQFIIFEVQQLRSTLISTATEDSEAAKMLVQHFSSRPAMLNTLALSAFLALSSFLNASVLSRRY